MLRLFHGQTRYILPGSRHVQVLHRLRLHLWRIVALYLTTSNVIVNLSIQSPLKYIELHFESNG